MDSVLLGMVDFLEFVRGDLYRTDIREAYHSGGRHVCAPASRIIDLFWFSVFGRMAMHVQRFEGGNFPGLVTDNVAVSLHFLLEYLPWTEFIQWIASALIVIYFIISSDSGSFVDDMVTSGGNPNPPVANRVFGGSPKALWQLCC